MKWRKRMIQVSAVILALALPIDAAKSQTLEQTTAFIIEGGAVDLSQMTTNPDGSVDVPQHTILGPFTLQPQMTVRAVNKEQCVIESKIVSAAGQPEKTLTFYFNRIVSVHRDSASTRTPFGNVTNIWAESEQPYVCFVGGGSSLQGQPLPPSYCPSNSDAALATVRKENIKTVLAAIDYLYGRYCKFARKKSAF